MDGGPLDEFALVRCDDREWRSLLSFFSAVVPAARDRGDGVRRAGEVRGELRGLRRGSVCVCAWCVSVCVCVCVCFGLRGNEKMQSCG